MKSMTVSEFKTHFSELLDLIKKGEKIKILYGKSKKPVAMLVPIEKSHEPRKLGMLEAKALFKETQNSKITEEEFLSS